MMVLCLEKELRYDNPGRRDPKQQAMRINDSPDRLQTCSGASGSIESGLRGTAFSVRAGVPFRRNTHPLVRGFAVFCVPVACYHALRRA
jgi:hypothetical protein